MSTRDQTRQELKDLARLAAAMPKEGPGMPPAVPESASGGLSASRVTVPPAIASVPSPPTLRPQRPSFFATAPSASPAVQPVSRAAALLALIPAPGSGWRGAWAVVAGGTLAAAMVGGLLLGQALTSHPAAASATEPAGTATAAAPETSAIPGAALSATVTPTVSSIPTSTETAAAAPAPLPVTDNSFTVRAPRPAHHAEPRPAPKPAVASAPPPSSTPTTKAPPPAAKAPASHPGAHDSLDDLIRKAAAGN